MSKDLSVFYDHQTMISQRIGGISRYHYELAVRLPKMGVDVNIACIRNINYYFSEMLGIHDRPESRSLVRLISLLNKCNSLRRLRKHYDIIHPTLYDPYLIGHCSGKLIVTVHDMMHEKGYVIDDKTVARKRRMVHAADRIITVSQCTKNDLLEYYPELDAEKIRVSHQGFSMSANDSKSRRFRFVDGPYILFVGGRGGYKNFGRFVEAMKPILSSHKELQVFCTGGEFTSEESELFGEYSSRFHSGKLIDSEMSSAYANALCFVFPSEYEGFGLPILEAFACGCPVVCSSSSCFPEVAGDSAEYFDPLNVDEMSAKIQSVIDDDSLRESLSFRGRERLKLFDWDKTARETLEYYKEAISDD